MELTEFGRQLLGGKKAVIFDLDGTLIDSLSYWDYSYRDLFERFPDAYFDISDFYANTAGKTLREHAEYQIEKYRLPLTAQQVTEFWPENFFSRYWGKGQFYERALDLLGYLNRNGVKTAVCTAGAECLWKCFEGQPARPQLFLSCETYGRAKPDPFIYLEAMRQLGVEQRECIIFEDSARAIQGALKTAAYVVAVTINGRGLEQRRKATEFHVDSWEQLIK